jgi:hypothetical protein
MTNKTNKTMRLSILSFVLLTLAAISGTAALQAQSTTQGSITGTVLDTTSAVIPSAAVKIQNTGTGFALDLVADASGYFKAPLLEPGSYTVTITAPNFAKFLATQVTVIVGQVTTLEPRLAVGSSSAVVTVTDQTPTINLDSPDFQGTVTAQTIQNVPINNRRWSALALMTPGVTVDSSGYGLISVRGISTILNNVEIDGADDNQAFFSEERGRTREAYSTSGSAVREFAVNTGVYSAEYGRAAGGVINSVTKSGTDQFHGQAYFYDRESNWNAFNDYTTETVLVNGANSTIKIKPEDLRKIYGFTVGGPIIKNKLFWIYTYDQHTHVFPTIGVPNSPSQFYTQPQGALSAGETCNVATGALAGAPTAAINDAQACALAARQGVSYAQAAYDWTALIFGTANTSTANFPGAAALPFSDLGLNSALGSVSRFGYQEINTPKLDWQASPKEHVSVLYHRLRWDSPGGVQTTATDTYSKDAQGNDFVKLDYGVAKLTSLITGNISNEVLFQYGRELDDEGQQPYTPYTLADLKANGNVPYFYAGSSYGFNIGSPYYSYRNAYPDERKYQIGDIVYWLKGNHSFKFGIDTVHNNDLINALSVSTTPGTASAQGYYKYTYVGNLLNDILNNKNGVTVNTTNNRGCDANSSQNGSSVVGPYPCYSSFGQAFGNPAYALSTLDFGAFAQDNWKFSPRLTLELGLRWDHEFYPGPDPNLTTATGAFLPYTGILNNPTDNSDFGPRVGFSYDVFGRGKTVLRGGYGLYYGRLTNGNIETIRLNTGSPNGQFGRSWASTWSATNPGGPTFPTIFATGASAACTAGSSACPSSYFMAPNVKLPEVQEFDLLLQQDLGKGTSVSVSYLGGLGRRLPNFLNVNLNPANVTTDTLTIAGDPNGIGPLGTTGKTYTTSVYKSNSYGNTTLLGPNATGFSNISEFITNINSSYNALVIEAVNHTLKILEFDASYTWSHSLDYTQQSNTQGATNNWYDPYTNYRINYGNSTWNIPNRLTAYALYRFPNLNSANPVKWVANGWSLNDSFQMQNGLPFTAGLSGSLNGAASSGWNGSGGQSLIPSVGLMTYRYPRKITDDARLQKEIAFERGVNLQLLLNIYNVANHQNITGYSASYLYLISSPSAGNSTLTYTGQNGTGAKTFLVPNASNNSNFTYTPRYVEIAFRLNF